MTASSRKNLPRGGLLPLLTGFGVMLALMAALLLFSLDRLKAMHQDMITLEKVANEKVRAVSVMREAIRKRSYSLVLTPTLPDYFDRDDERGRFNSYQREYIIARETLLKLGLTKAEKGHLDAVQEKLRGVMAPVERAMEIAVQGEPEKQVWSSIQTAVSAQRDMIEALNGLVGTISGNTSQKVDETLAEYETTRLGMIFLGGGVFIIGILIAASVITRESRSTRTLMKEISRRLEAEAVTKDMNTILEDKVRTRTAALSEAVDALKIARDDAETANLTKSQFLATMSHELRTPLNAIIGFSDAIKQEVHGPIGHEQYGNYVSDIKQSGHHLLALINDILDISVIEAGKMELAPETLCAAHLVETSLRLVRPVAEKALVQLETEIAEDLPAIRGDERRTKQILVNLLSNAVKFTPEDGRVVVAVSATSDGDAVTFTVTDTGIGMDEDGIEKALTKFGQVDSDLARRYDGTGLGLPLAKELTEAQGGSFTVESTPWAGTTVSVTLPADRTQDS